jgi:pyruvate/2-oxoglutarate dehydrogenase complex dihydrolipoamide dehydrogenase (E3) component
MSTTGAQFDYDLAVIGGGYAAARTAMSDGLKTVVLEGGEEVGGLCILRGCMRPFRLPFSYRFSKS